MIVQFRSVALATIAVLAASAHAQSSVNVYGIVDVGLASLTNLTAAAGAVGSTHSSAVTNGLMDASFLGLRGSEDMGGGLKTVFSLETYFDASTGQASGGGNLGVGGGSAFWGRNTFVGLEGGFGRVTLGHTDSLAYQATSSFSPFMSSDYFAPAVRLAFDPNAIDAGLDQGWSKTITYTSPDFSGFNVAAQFRPKGGDAGANYALSAGYAQGALALNANYEQIKAPAALLGGKDKVWGLNASYDFTVLKAYAQYGELKNTGSGSDLKSKVWQLGVGAPVGTAGSLMASYGERKDAGVAGSQKLRDFSVGYDYNLSKRTFVYVAALNERAQSGSASKSGNTLAVGLHHTF